MSESKTLGPIRLVLSTAREVLVRREKFQLVVLGFLVIVGVSLELLALGLFVPAIGILTNGESLSELRNRFALLQGWSDGSVLLVLLGVLASVYLVKNLYSLGSIWYQRTVVANISTRLSTTLFRSYIHQPYLFHLRSNSSILIRNMQNAATLVSSGIDPLIGLTTDSLIAVGIVTLLFVVSPIPTLFVIVTMGVMGYLLHRTVRRRIAQLGIQRNIHNAKTLQHQQQGLGSIKTLKVTGREKQFIEVYGHHVIQNNLVNRTYGLLQQVPRLWIEMLTVLGLSGLVLILTAQGQRPSEAIPVLGLFGVAAFRIQPSVTRILLSLQSLAFSSAAINSVRNDFSLPFPAAEGGSAEEFRFESLTLDEVGFEYPGRDHAVLTEVSIRIERGERIGISGRSGAGKSTLADLMLGLLDPTVGSIWVNETEMRSCRHSWQRRLGYVPQDIYLIDDSIAQNVSFGLPPVGDVLAQVERALEKAQLADFVASLPDGVNTMVGEKGVRLSGGQRQRIGIARALLDSPDVLLFDEATSSLDTETERDFLGAIEAVSKNRTVIVIAHRASTLSRCDRILRVEDGRVLDLGRPTPEILDRIAGDKDDDG